MPTPIKATISGSSSSTVLGLNKYQSTFQFWLKTMEDLEPGFCDKNGYLYEKFDGNAATRFGHAFELANIEITENKLGCVITDQERVFTETYNGVPLSSHVDGLIEIDGKTVLFEGKTTTERAFNSKWDIATNGIPKVYMTQLQHNMFLSGTDEAIISVLVFPFVPADMEKKGYEVCIEDGEYFICHKDVDIAFDVFTDWAEPLSLMGYHHIFKIKRDEELIQEMLNRYESFWTNHVLTKTPPSITGYDDIKHLIASPSGEIEATEEMKELWSEKCDIENEIKSLLDRKDAIKDSFSVLIQKEIESKNIKEGHEDKKLNIYAGALKLGSITRGVTRTSVNKKMVAKVKDDYPEIYETMKKTTFLDLLSEEIDLTDKQAEKLESVDNRKDGEKFLKSLKLTKLLSKDSIIKTLEKNKPELYEILHNNSFIEETTPTSVLRLTKNSEE